METTINQRFRNLFEVKKMTANSVAEALGYKGSEKISRIVRQGSTASPSYEILNDMLTSNLFEDISPLWLVTGRGQMIADKSESGLFERLIAEHGDKFRRDFYQWYGGWILENKFLSDSDQQEKSA